jgi:hypothetical protein
MADVELYVNAESEPIAERKADCSTLKASSSLIIPESCALFNRIVNDYGRSEDLAIEVFWKMWRKPPRKTADAGDGSIGLQFGPVWMSFAGELVARSMNAFSESPRRQSPSSIGTSRSED